MPGLLTRNTQFGNASAASLVGGGSVTAASCPGGGIWSKQRDDITFDQLQKFWSELPIQARQELLRIDKQTLFEQARKNLYCSRCNGLLLEGFSQIVMYGKSLQQEGAGSHSPSKTVGAKTQSNAELDEVQDPSVHPWGGLATTKDGILTLLDCFINERRLEALQNVFDSARARERERELLYPDACGGGGRGWISQGMPNYGRGHGTRETCALHTARLSCDTLVDFWSALGDETRSSLLRMKEEDFIERLMYRFDSKRFCRDCRRNVIREFKELKELKRMRREPRCTSWFCVADTAFQYEVSEDTVLADWHQSFTDTVGTYHHFEWAIGTGEGKSDILDFEDVGMNGKVQVNGLDLGGLSACFITLRAWKLDGRCTELCVKAHALKGQPCVHRRLIVGDGFVTITKGESIRRFFEHAEEAEEEEDDDAMDKDSNELDGDGSRPQKHAKSPELAREFLLDAATVIFKEQVEKAFREGTARQNAHSIFVCLALKLLEERVHVACKEIITLEKQTKLLEEEEREKREEEERKERKRMKEREKKLRRKERLKGKERERERKLIESKSLDNASPTSLDDSPMGNHDDSLNNLDSGDSISELGDVTVLARPVSPDDVTNEQSSSGFIDEKNLRIDSLQHWCPVAGEPNARDGNDSFIIEQSKSSRRKLRFRKDSLIDQGHQASNWYDKRRPSIDNGCTIEVDESDTNVLMMASCRSMNGVHRPSRERDKNNVRNFNPKFGEKFNCANSRTRDRYEFQSCSCKQHGDYRAKGGYHISTSRLGKEINTANKTESTLDMPRSFYRSIKYSNGCNLPDNSVISKVKHDGGAPSKDVLHVKQVWEPMDARKKCPRSSSDPEITLGTAGKVDPPAEVGYNKDENRYQHPHNLHAHDDLCSSGHSEHLGKAACQVNEDRSKNLDKSGSCADNGCQTQFVLVANSDCDSKNELEEGSNPALSPFPLSSGCDPGTSSSSSDNCSSCLSEGDSSTSSSSAQNAESSSTSDSEDACQQSDSRDILMCNGSSFRKFLDEAPENNYKTTRGDSLLRTSTGFPAKSCIEDSFARGKQTKAVQNSDDGRCGYDMAPSQQHMLPMHTHSMHVPIFPSPAVGYHSQNTVSWSAASANGLMPYSQHNRYVFHSHLGYGLPANQSSDFCMQYNTPKPLTAPVFDMSQHLHQAANRNNAAHPKEQGKNFDTHGPQQVSPAVEPIGSLHPLERSCQSRHLPLKLLSAGQNCSVKNAAKPHTDSSSFSLFHFGGPVAGVAAGYKNPLSLKEETAGGFVSDSPAVQARTCSKEETKVEEYSLFSTRNGARFSFF